MYRISKKFEFSAAHRLEGLSADHQCSRIHGHNYVVEVVLESATLNEVGFVRDYHELDSFKRWLDEKFDHRWLGNGTLTSSVPLEDLPKGTHAALGFNPTAENMAKFFYQYAETYWPEVSMVGVSETPKTWAWYAPMNLTLEVLDAATDRIPEPHRQLFLQALREAPVDSH